MKNLVIIGGGLRQSKLAAKLGSSANVMHFTKTVPEEALHLCDAVILPLPVSTDGKFITESSVPIDSIFGYGDKLYIGGRFSDAFDEYKDKYRLTDYVKCEEFAIKNAVPTAEAAISIAIENTPFTLWNATCIVTGYGRISRILSKMLKNMSADVTVCVRNPLQKALAEADGFKVTDYTGLKKRRCNILFNTVPSQVLDEDVLLSVSPNLLIDLASLPGGCDFEAAKKLNIPAIHALSLPGKTAPDTAALITAETILSLL